MAFLEIPSIGSWLFVAYDQKKQALEILVPIALFIVVIWAISTFTRKYEARRTRKIQAALNSLGFTLREESEGLHLPLLGPFKLGQRGSLGKISHHFESALHPDRITHLMDYSFRTGKCAVHQTIAVISDRRFDLPVFVLAPEGFFSRIFGGRDIDFDGFPKFSTMFKLQGDDEAAVRTLFTPTVIEECEQHPGMTLEGHGADLLMFREGKRVIPQDFPIFHNGAQQLARLFLP